MESCFSNVRQQPQHPDCGVHPMLASNDASKDTPDATAGSYGVRIRVQGIGGHPYIVLNNTEGKSPEHPFQTDPGLLQRCDPENDILSSGAFQTSPLAPSESAAGEEKPDAGPRSSPLDRVPSDTTNPPSAEANVETVTTGEPTASEQDASQQEVGCARVTGGPNGVHGSLSFRSGSADPVSPPTYREPRKSRPDLLPFRRQDSAGSTSTVSRRSSASSLYQFFLADQARAIYADNVNRHENRRYVPFLPGTGRGIDTGPIPAVDRLIEKFDRDAGPSRRSRPESRSRIRRGRSRSADIPLPSGRHVSPDPLDEPGKDWTKLPENLPQASSRVCLKKPSPRGWKPPSRGEPPASRTIGKLQGAARNSRGGCFGSLQYHRCGNVAGESLTCKTSALPAQADTSEKQTATPTLLISNRMAPPLGVGAKTRPPQFFSSASSAQVTPDLLEGRREREQPSDEETAKQTLYNYLKEGSSENEDATKRKVDLVFEKIQALMSRADGGVQGSDRSADVATASPETEELKKEISELRRALDVGVKDRQVITEEKDAARAEVTELRRRLEATREEKEVFRKHAEEREKEFRQNMDELFQVKMERDQQRTEIQDLRDQLSEMYDELDCAKRAKDGERELLIQRVNALSGAKTIAEEMQRSAVEHAKELADQNRQLTGRLADLENERMGVYRDNKRLMGEAALLEARIARGENDTLRLEDALARAQEEGRELASAKSSLEAQLEEAQARLTEEALRGHQRARKEALAKTQLLEETANALACELEANNHLKEDRAKQAKIMEDKMARLELELDEERTNSDLLSGRIGRCREQIEQMRNELLRERAARQDLECDKISLERQNKDLKSRILHLEGSYRSGQEGLLVQMEARIIELEEKLENEERDRANLQLSNRRLDRKVKELVMQMDDERLSLTDRTDQLSLRLKAMKRQLEEAEGEIDRLASAKKKLERELEEQVDVNDQLRGQLNAMQKELSRRKKPPNKAWSDLEDEDDDAFSTDGESLRDGPPGSKSVNSDIES